MFYLFQYPARQSLGKVGFVIAKHRIRQVSETLQLVFWEVATGTLRKTINKKGVVTGTKQNNRPEATRLSSASAGDSLFYHATSEVGVNQPSISPDNRVVQGHVLNPLPLGEALEPSRQENSHFLNSLSLEKELQIQDLTRSIVRIGWQ
jgi:hypothetical protein